MFFAYFLREPFDSKDYVIFKSNYLGYYKDEIFLFTVSIKSVKSPNLNNLSKVLKTKLLRFY